MFFSKAPATTGYIPTFQNVPLFTWLAAQSIEDVTPTFLPTGYVLDGRRVSTNPQGNGDVCALLSGCFLLLVTGMLVRPEVMKPSMAAPDAMTRITVKNESVGDGGLTSLTDRPVR